MDTTKKYTVLEKIIRFFSFWKNIFYRITLIIPKIKNNKFD